MMLSSSARRTTTVGEMTTLIATNVNAIEFMCFLGLLVIPLRFSIGLWALYKYLGVSTFVGLIAMVVCLPLNGILGKLAQQRRNRKYKIQDARLKMMNELLNGIRVRSFCCCCCCCCCSKEDIGILSPKLSACRVNNITIRSSNCTAGRRRLSSSSRRFVTRRCATCSSCGS